MEATGRQKGIGIAERPVELIYALDERPPWLQLLVLGLQHVAVICPYLVMVVLVVEVAKLPHDTAQSALGLAMIAVAVMTILQSLRVRPELGSCPCLVFRCCQGIFKKVCKESNQLRMAILSISLAVSL